VETTRAQEERLKGVWRGVSGWIAKPRLIKNDASQSSRLYPWGLEEYRGERGGEEETETWGVLDRNQSLAKKAEGRRSGEAEKTMQTRRKNKASKR